MIYGPAFYKLLGIPESVAEPTAYHLLGLDPRMVTEGAVDEALAARKAGLRRDIPGPQFVPIVAAIERELDVAAMILRDPRRRYEYNETLLGRAKAGKDEPTGEQRSRIVAECRQIVRSMVGHDGTLAMVRRDELAGRLHAAGMGEQDVRYVMEHIPCPPGEAAQQHAPTGPGDAGRTGEADEPAGKAGRSRAAVLAETMAFFLAAVDMEIRDGLLGGVDERKLMTLAERLDIDAKVALSGIEDRLSALGASCGERNASALAAQFKLRLLAMFPTADATVADRKRLLSLAAAEGLGAAEAGKVIDDYFRPRTGGASQPKRWPGLLVAGVVLGMSVLVAAALWSEFSRRLSRGGDANALVAGVSRAGGGPSSAPSGPLRPVVLDAAIAALSDPARARRLLDNADSGDRTAAFGILAGTMVHGGTPSEAVSAEMLLEVVLGCPPASPACQNAAVTALIDRLATRAAPDANSSALGGQSVRPPAPTALGLLSRTLLLRGDPLADANDPDEVAAPFLDRCRRVWRESVAAAPADPVNDPKRLAYAVVDGGSLGIYAERADAARFSPLAAELAAMACDPNRPGSDKALAALGSTAGSPDLPPGLVNIARLALADAAGAASNAASAGAALTALADAMGLGPRHALRQMLLDSPPLRRQAAEEMRRVIQAGGGEAQTAPATKPDQGLPAGVFNAVLAFSVRGTWSSTYADEALAADLATTMLACAARVERLSLHTDALHRELGAVLSQRDLAARTARLTRDVVLTDVVVAAVIATPIGLDPNVADALRKGLRSQDSGERLQAIDVLQRLGGPPAGEVLLDRLDELVRTGNSGDLTVINRLLRALTKIDDPRLPDKLAALIEPAKTNAMANSIVMTLLNGTGRAGNTDQANYLLPVSHNTAQRKAAAAQWQAVAKSAGWGPGQMDRAIGVKKVPEVAWQPDGQTEKLLAAFVYYAGNAGQMLRAFKPAGQAATTTAPGAGRAPAVPGGAAKIPAPVTGDELAVAADTLAGELARLARAADAAGKFTARLDEIENHARARVAASGTAMQAAAVRLDQAARTLEVLVRQADGRPETDAAIRSLRSAHEKILAATTNVLDELRELAFQNLVLLEQLAREGQ